MAKPKNDSPANDDANGGERRFGYPANLSSAPELIVMMRPDVRLRSHAAQVASATGADVSSLNALIASQSLSLVPLFGVSEERLEAEAAELAAARNVRVPDLSRYYRVTGAPEDRLEQVREQFMALETVEGAYIQPVSGPPSAASQLDLRTEDRSEAFGLNAMLPLSADAPPVSPNFQDRQGYLGAAPGGIEALWAHTQPGGQGQGVRIIDLEWGWNFAHEDLQQQQGGVLDGGNSPSNDHGTAVLGVIGGDSNSFGILGCAPAAVQSALGFNTLSSAEAIHRAANRLGRGDIMILEIHRAGPRATGAGQFGFIAIEWWPADFDAICYAAARGIIVIEAAGNGSQNLDDSIYDTPQAGFPPDWRNPFRRGTRDSGAILVGAGAPPEGTHGRNHGPDRSRLDFSNYGQALDAQGWGREVTTTGYGDLQGGSDRNVWYTDTFSGTSSASPVVASAIACTQGILRSRGLTPLSPERARALLRSTGSPQTDAPGRPRSQRIGNRPNVRQLVASASARPLPRIGVQFRGTIGANQTQRWFTFNWPAQWHVLWSVVPTTPNATARQLRWDVEVERASHAFITYWIVITNLTAEPVQIEGRYAILGET